MALREKVEDALKKVRPSLQADGGDVQLGWMWMQMDWLRLN